MIKAGRSFLTESVSVKQTTGSSVFQNRRVIRWFGDTNDDIKPLSFIGHFQMSESLSWPERHSDHLLCRVWKRLMIEGSLCPPLSQSEGDDGPSLRLKDFLLTSSYQIFPAETLLPSDFVLAFVFLAVLSVRTSEYETFSSVTCRFHLLYHHLNPLYTTSIIHAACAMCQIQPEALKQGFSTFL